MCKLIFAFVLVFILDLTESARVLCVFPYPSLGHQIVFRSLTEELVQRGHELVIITPDPGYAEDNQTNIKEINIHDATYGIWKAGTEDILKDAIKNPDNGHLSDFSKTLHDLFVKQFNLEQVQKVIKEEDDTFDLLILEAEGYSSMILTSLIKAPVVWVSSHGSVYNYNAMGVRSQEFLYPTQFRRKIGDVPIWDKFKDIYDVVSYEYFLENLKEIQNEWFKSVMGYEVTTEELQKNIDLLMINHFPLWEGFRPVPQNVIYLGGVHTRPGEELPEDLQQFFNTSTNGVIYVSFGTAVETNYLSPDTIQILVNVLSQLPYNVLWKWDGDELPGKRDNIITSKWFPQADLLRHPKVELFITQGGLQSTDEAIAAGVPLIGIPFLDDQFFNVENYKRHKIGLGLDITTLTEKDLKDAISKVITDKGYRENIFELRTLMRDKPKGSLVQAISWIEYILKNQGAKHLRSPAANLTWTLYLELELLFIALFFFVTMVLMLVILCKWTFKGVRKWYRSYKHRRLMDGMHYLR